MNFDITPTFRGNSRQQHGNLDVQRWPLDALQRFQRYERHRAEIPLVRLSLGERKYEFVSGNSSA